MTNIYKMIKLEAIAMRNLLHKQSIGIDDRMKLTIRGESRTLSLLDEDIREELKVFLSNVENITAYKLNNK